MALYAIGDLHLSLSPRVDKPMDIFGDKWLNHAEQIKNNWQLENDDTAIIAGDISWAMDFSQLAPDFEFIDSLPGKKIIIKGNHDYWWNTSKKMNTFTASYPSITVLNNKAVYTQGVYICGTRGWIAEPNETADEKILAREAGRLRLSLSDANGNNAAEKIVFLHYPPLLYATRCDELLQILSEFGVKRCYYGHLHGKAIRGAYTGEYNGITFNLISADYLGFTPLKIDI